MSYDKKLKDMGYIKSHINKYLRLFIWNVNEFANSLVICLFHGTVGNL